MEQKYEFRRRAILDVEVDGWCLGVSFFIQIALFNKTGMADWIIEGRTYEPHHMADGVFDATYTAWRHGGSYKERITNPLRICADSYSYQSVMNAAEAAVAEAKFVQEAT